MNADTPTFYSLREPVYATDPAFARANPITIHWDLYLPGIICSVCGATSAGGRELYLPIDDPALAKRLRGGPIRDIEWHKLAEEVRRATGVGKDFRFLQGDLFGRPRFKLRNHKLHDFLHPLPGELVVKETVVNALQNAGLTCFRALPIEPILPTKLKRPEVVIPPLYLLQVNGSAWRVGMDPEELLVCRACRRTRFPDPDWIVIDLNRWDGSDFFHVDDNWRMILVTQRVRDLLERSGFTNYLCTKRPIVCYVDSLDGRESTIRP